MKRSEIVLLGLIMGVFVVLVLDPVTFLRRGEFRGEVRMLYEALEPAMTRQQVRAAMESGKFPHLRLHTDDDRRWLAVAPLEFGAQNWVLSIESRMSVSQRFRFGPTTASNSVPPGCHRTKGGFEPASRNRGVQRLCPNCVRHEPAVPNYCERCTAVLTGGDERLVDECGYQRPSCGSVAVKHTIGPRRDAEMRSFLGALVAATLAFTATTAQDQDPGSESLASFRKGLREH